MNKKFRDDIFKNYSKVQVAYNNDDDSSAKKTWYRSYYNKYYSPIFNNIDISCPVLEIGCNRGYLLDILYSKGYRNLTGIDLSPQDIDLAKIDNVNINYLCEDAFEYLKSSPNKYNCILLKAVLEHIDKKEIPALIEVMKDSLTEDGVLVIDVPNMDWIFASHERYMDFTHEVGFTRQSLNQILKMYFKKVDLVECDNNLTISAFGRIKMKIFRYILNFMFTAAEPECSGNALWCRSLIAIAKNIKLN